MIRHLFGEITDIQASVANFQNIPIEDTAQIHCKLLNGAHGTIDVSWTVPAPSPHYLEIYGENGTMLLDLKGLSYKLRTWSDWQRLNNKSDEKQNFAGQFHHFVAAINGKEPSIIKNDDGLQAQRIIEQAYQSINGKSEPVSA